MLAHGPDSVVAGCGAAARVVLKETSDASTDDYDESSETTASRLLTDPYENGGSVTMQHANERSNKSSVSALAFATHMLSMCMPPAL